MRISKITLQVLSAYLPYKVQMVNITLDRKYKLGTNNIEQVWARYAEGETHNKPLLRPLSDLTKEIEHNGERFVPIERLNELNNKSDHVQYFLDDENDLLLKHTNNGYNVLALSIITDIQFLLSLHMDIFGLIDSGDALPLTDKLIELNNNKS